MHATQPTQGRAAQVSVIHAFECQRELRGRAGQGRAGQGSTVLRLLSLAPCSVPHTAERRQYGTSSWHCGHFLPDPLQFKITVHTVTDVAGNTPSPREGWHLIYVEHMPPCKAMGSPLSDNSPHILLNRNVHCRVHKSLTLGPVRGQMNPFHDLPVLFLLRSILIRMLSFHRRVGLPGCLFHSGFATGSLYISLLYHTCHYKWTASRDSVRCTEVSLLLSTLFRLPLLGTT
jgi:hypothetical protein